MTRKEQILQKAGSIVDGMRAHSVSSYECRGYYEGFIDGARWADKTHPIPTDFYQAGYDDAVNKFVEWIGDNVRFQYFGAKTKLVVHFNGTLQQLKDAVSQAMRG